MAAVSDASVVEGVQGGVKKRYTAVEAEGFTIMLCSTLEWSNALREHITLDLAEVCKVVPKEKLDILRTCKFWFNDASEYQGEQLRGACHHPNAGWLEANGNMACKGGGIEIYRVADYLDWSTHTQPSMLLHELSHHLHNVCQNSEQGAREWFAEHGSSVSVDGGGGASGGAVVWAAGFGSRPSLNGAFRATLKTVFSGGFVFARTAPTGEHYKIYLTNSNSGDCGMRGINADRWHIEMSHSPHFQPGQGRVVGYCMDRRRSECFSQDVRPATTDPQVLAFIKHADLLKYADLFAGMEYAQLLELDQDALIVMGMNKKGPLMKFKKQLEKVYGAKLVPVITPSPSVTSAVTAAPLFTTPPEKGWSLKSSSKTNDTIAAAYAQSMKAGLYTAFSERCHCGKGPKGSATAHYAATNHSEYFAECSEAFFSSSRFRNDYYPYVHPELQGFDQAGYRMCEAVWGVSGASLPTRHDFPPLWHTALKGGGLRRSDAFAESHEMV